LAPFNWEIKIYKDRLFYRLFMRSNLQTITVNETENVVFRKKQLFKYQTDGTLVF